MWTVDNIRHPVRRMPDILSTKEACTLTKGRAQFVLCDTTDVLSGLHIYTNDAESQFVYRYYAVHDRRNTKACAA